MSSRRTARPGVAALIIAVAATTAANGADQPPAGLEPGLLAVTVNAQNGGEPAVVLRGADGELYVSREDLKRWRLTLDAPRSVKFDGATYVAITKVPGLTLKLSDETQSLDIVAEPALLEHTVLSIEGNDPGPMTASGRGAFLNYQLLGQVADGEITGNGAFELGLFGGGGFGTSSFIGGLGQRQNYLTRLDTSWTIDDPDRMRSLRLGDGITRGGIGGAPVRFGGVQLASNFAVQPGFVTIPLPSLGGSAALPSVVDIYVNNSRHLSRDIAPGPFSITDLPVLTGGGEVRLIVRDMLGRETVISQPYYTTRQLLRPRLHDYSYEMGLLRHNFARDSNDYGAMMVSTTHRYGITDAFTAEAHVEATRHVQTVGSAGNFVVPGIASFEVSAAASNGPDGRGAQWGLSFEHQSRGISFGGRSEFTTRHFANLGSLRGHEPASRTLQVHAGIPFDSGSIGASYLRRDGRGTPDAELLTANVSFRLRNLGTLYFAARKNLRDSKDTALELYFARPFGSRGSANAGLQHQNGGTLLTTDLQRSLPAGPGLGYRLSMAKGPINRLDARVSVQTIIGNYDAELTWTDQRTGARIVAGGAIAWVDGDAFASRRLNQSFATVKVDQFSNVRIYADNQLVGKTNRKGVAIVPRLRAFEKNYVRIELADLPIDTSIAHGEQAVRPYNRSGVAIRFDVHRSRGAVINIRLEDGEALPAGSLVRLEGSNQEFVAAPGGEVYLTGLGERNIVQATLAGRACRFSFPFRPTDDPQPRLGTFTCAAGGT